MAEENKTTAEETAEEVKETEAAKEMLEVHNDCKRIIMRYVTEEEKAVMDRVMQKMLRSLDEELQK